MLADKTTNIYQLTPEYYNKLLNENITKDYQKTTHSAVHTTSKEAKNIAECLTLADRIEDQSNKPAYITLKDHKENFLNKPKCRLINPAKTQIGKISKQLLSEINEDIRNNTQLQQWRSTAEMLAWFSCIPHKSRKTFMQIDIVEYYPSISESLLDKALAFASRTLKQQIPLETIRIIKNSRNSFLYTRDTDNHQPWRKKSGPFDVTMGAPDGAEVCELVGLVLLAEVSKRFPELNFGLYRDDGLASHSRIPGPKLDRIRKDLHNLFAEFGLKITIETNLKQVNFLDTTLNLDNDTYAPYRKPNDTPLYIDINSNHPPNIIREIPNTINSRLNSISSTKYDFDSAKPDYQKALRSSGYNQELSFCQNHKNNSHRNDNPNNKQQLKKKRKIIWYNPPFNKNVKTNIGKSFLKLIDEHFTEKHPLRQVINRNCVKISYSCTPNIEAIIQAHNTKILKKYNEATAENMKRKTCNCRKKNECPLEGKCNTGAILYKATIESKEGEFFYIGSTQNFKERHGNHKASLNTYQFTSFSIFWKQIRIICFELFYQSYFLSNRDLSYINVFTNKFSNWITKLQINKSITFYVI